MSDNWRESEFRDLLNALLRGRDAAVPTVKALAIAMGMGERWVYAVLDGGISPGPEQLMALISAIGHEDCYRWLEDRLPGWRLVRNGDGAAAVNGRVDDDLMALSAGHGRLCQAYLDAAKDGTLDAKERARLLTYLAEIEMVCETVRAEIQRAGGGK